MRFILMHKQDKHSEADIPPSPELMAAMGAFLAEAAASGAFLSGEGLNSSSKRSRLNFSAGQFTLTDGPFRGSNELIAGFVMLQVKSKDEAIEWARRMHGVLGDGEIEIGLVKENWDLGFCPKPDDAPLRFLLLRKAGQQSESGALPAKQAGEMARLTGEMREAGVFLASEWLQPSSRGSRLKISKNKQTVLDGPFTESKELIGGFAMVQVDSKEDAIDWSCRFARILSDAGAVGEVEIDVRPLV